MVRSRGEGLPTPSMQQHTSRLPSVCGRGGGGLVYLLHLLHRPLLLLADFDGLDSADSDVEGSPGTVEDSEGLLARLREAEERAERYRLGLEQSLKDMELMR